MNVSARLLRAVALAQSTEETRYYLCGVHVEPRPDGGVILVATDGKVMTVAHDPTGSCDGKAIYPIGKKMLSDLKAKRADRAVFADGTLMVVGEDGAALGMHAVVPLDGTFPDWRRGLPVGVSAPASGSAFAVKYLDAVHRTAKMLGVLTCTIFDNGVSPATIKYAGCADIFSVLMPCTHDEVAGFPIWMSGK